MTFDAARCAASACPSGYVGTSMAAPHVSATAALVIASGVLGPHPTPAAVEAPPEGDGARPRRARAADSRYGAGLVDAARARPTP